MTLFEITRGERAYWQRRVTAELATILNTHRDLPVIAWTIGTAGATLVGHLDGRAPAAEVRRVFESWRVALMLPEHTEVTCGSQATYLQAGADHHRVRVRLTATVFDDQDEAVGS